MITLRKAKERGVTSIDWLESRFSFSFDHYWDDRFHHYSDLRVLNDDRMQAKGIFELHPHDNMEIYSYVIAGELAHKDSMGVSDVVKAGEVQGMSAGTGILHSEENPSASSANHFLQFWVYPDKNNYQPRYEKKFFSVNDKQNRLAVIISPDSRENSLHIRQDCLVYASLLEQDKQALFLPRKGRKIYLHLPVGRISINGQELSAGDGAFIAEEDRLTITGSEPSGSELVIWDLK